MVSIIIPVYNREAIVVETLVSIQNQTYLNWECIIVDDGSSDNTFSTVTQFIQEDVRFQIVHRPKGASKGPSSCRNYGFLISKGTYIQFFDSDDIMHPDHLQEKVDRIGSNDFVVCKLQEFSGSFSEKNSLKQKFPDIVKVENIFESFATGEFYMLMMVAPLWKREAITPFMPIREDMHILEDHELYARVLFEKNKYAIINRELIYYRVGLSSLLNRFYNDVNFGLDSYFEAKKTVLELSNNPKIKLAIFKMTLALLRLAMVQKQYDSAKRCLSFCRKQRLAYSLVLKLKMIRIYFFFSLFLITKRGDTFFKSMFKI